MEPRSGRHLNHLWDSCADKDHRPLATTKKNQSRHITRNVTRNVTKNSQRLSRSTPVVVLMTPPIHQALKYAPDLYAAYLA